MKEGLPQEERIRNLLTRCIHRLGGVFAASFYDSYRLGCWRVEL
jgi:hypothetical protein